MGVRSRPPRGLRGGGQRHHADRVPPGRPGELPDGGRGVGRGEPRHPAALGRVDGRGRARHPRDPRCRQRRPQRLRRHQGDVLHRRGRVEAGDRGAGGPVPEALRRVRRAHEPDERHRRSRLRGQAIERTTTVVIGAGHAGLAASHFLSDRSIDHVVLERGEVANSWRTERWDSLRLLTPNWQARLPGMTVPEHDPDGFMAMPEVVQLIDDYATTIDAPVRTRTTVSRVTAIDDGYEVATDGGVWRGTTVVLASGPANIANVPAFAE